MVINYSKLIDRYSLALENAIQRNPQGGLCGLELEWNLLDSQLRPLLLVGSGPNRLSFVDYLRRECLPNRLRGYSQLEVFHWMIEWATKPYFSPKAAVYEGRLLEAVLINGLDKAGREFNERLYTWHGNLPLPVTVSFDSIPGSWHIAKRRYLERCVQLYGESLATAGTHSNLSLPDPLFEWDFLQRSAARKSGKEEIHHLDEFKSQFYITATRLMRAFACLFIATSASTPFRPGWKGKEPSVFLTNFDSIRNLTFPNPKALDLPDLYRSLEDYLRLSYGLVRSGIRFGNNNWTPVRARSFAEPVERLIALTSEQLQELYQKGLFVLGEEQPFEDLAKEIELQNLIARINLPMARVEVRTDDGNLPLELEVANLTLKHLLMIRFYFDEDFARAFRYDSEDITRARQNEELAARFGLRAEISHPLTGKPIAMRDFLAWVLSELEPLAAGLNMADELIPLKLMATGGPNTSEVIRSKILERLGLARDEWTEEIEVPHSLLQEMAEEREAQVVKDVESITAIYPKFGKDADKLNEVILAARESILTDPLSPIRFLPRADSFVEMTFSDKTAEILALARKLIEIPSVTTGSDERLDEVRRAAVFIYDYLRNHGLGVRYYDQSKYPAILAGFPANMHAPVMLSGHFDVVAPEPDDCQFIPRVEGDYLWGRGAADMKTVVATFLVWMKDTMHTSQRFPPINLLLVGNEENGEVDPMGTPHVLKLLEQDNYAPEILIAGERTGETGKELWGEICTENRGVMRLEMLLRGTRGHTGTSASKKSLVQSMIAIIEDLNDIFEANLTCRSEDNWCSSINYSYIQVGTPEVFNITPDCGVLGVEIRPIPQDDLDGVLQELWKLCEAQKIELRVLVKENGVACSSRNPYLLALIEAVRQASGSEPRIGKKMPATSARFAPFGNGIVWGQSGIGPHSREERHYIPSIMPYYQALWVFGNNLAGSELTNPPSHSNILPLQ